MQGLEPHRVRGVLLFARRPSVGGHGSPLRGLRYLREEGRESGGAVGARRARWGGRLVDGRARKGDGVAVSSAAERHRAADRGRGAVGAGESRPGSPGRPRRWGPRSAEGPAPRSAGTNPAEHHPRGRILVEAGGSATPSPRGRTGPGRALPDGYQGGGRGGVPALRGPGPWWLWAGAGETGQAPGLGLVRGGVEGPGGLGGEPREAPGGWARAPEGGRSLRGGLLPARGTTGAPLERGGGGACIARCRAMSIHGCAAWDYIPNPPRRSPFFLGGGLRGGGGACGCCVPPPMRGGGSPVGAPSGLADKTRWRPLGSWAPSRKNLGFAGEDSAIWFGMVWYGMVWYGMVWYGMVWYGMIWYGMVWYGMVWYGMLLLLLLLGHPARASGRNCPTRSPWAGRKGAVGRRHAGVACADHDRGGGGGVPLSVWGQGARVAVRGTTCPCDPGSLPRRGGRACAPVRNGGGTGGGMKRPLARGPAGPGSPCFQPPPPRDWGGDYVRCGGGVRGWKGRRLCTGYYLAPVPVSRVREATRHGRRGGSGLGRARG